MKTYEIHKFSSNSTLEKHLSIQHLRALAAIFVILFHTETLHHGYGGVDLFFVISGFVMGKTGLIESPMNFMIKRIIRIVPLYWFVTIIMCVASLIPGLFRRFSFDTPSLIQSLLFIPHLNADGKIWPLIISGWTLNYEMFFYVIFSICLIIKWRAWKISVVMIALAALGFFMSSIPSPVIQTYTSPLLLEFAAGLFLSGLPAPRNPLFLGVACFVIAIALYPLLTFLVGAGEDTPWKRVLMLGIPSTAVVAGALWIEQAGLWPRLWVLEKIGDASYSLYLLHGIVIAFVHKVLHLPEIAQIFIILFFSISLSIISNILFEKPISRVLRSFLLRKRTFIQRPPSSNPSR
ncbi:acyltransferase family protein [Pararhodospirillum oryzae]|uniref:acyltransferase family protein n=1 Tax=Pararhodospirillum oryzae TaxID=478448 RepID=UPI0011BD81A9|nr:acyltransferase [Pararhodospirillum oryzae]